MSTTIENPEKPRGWGCPINSRKFHYFVGGESLCGRWWFGGRNLDDSDDDHSENCVACKRAKAKQDAAKAEAK